jgi:hypothetical protein
MAWTTARTWVTGEVVTAAQMNTHIRDNLNVLGRDYPGLRTVGTGGGFGESWHASLPMVGQSTAFVNNTMVANTIYASPLMCPRGTLDRMAFSVTASASGTIRHGIYVAASESDPYLSTLLVDSGAISVSTTGLKTTTISVDILPAKMYWMVMQTSANAPDTTAFATAFDVWYGLLGRTTWATSGDWLSAGFRMARTDAALPSTFPAFASATWENPRAFGVRYSA